MEKYKRHFSKLINIFFKISNIDQNIGKKIKFLSTFTEERLTDFFKKQMDIDGDLWLIEVVSKGYDLHSLFLKQGL